MVGSLETANAWTTRWERERERERERDFYGAVWQNDNMMRLDHDGEEFW